MKASVVFISYRRSDCAGYAGRLEDALERIYGDGSVFRDVHDIAAGEEFRKVIESCLQTTRAALVLIGPDWLGVRSDGTRRIDEPNDFVHLEVATALKRNCKVVPVLLPGGKLPRRNDLPEDVRELADRQALPLSETDWQSDLQSLVNSLGIPTLKRRRIIIAIAGILLLAAAGSAAQYWHIHHDKKLDASKKLVGTWQASVTYDWHESYKEEIVLKRFAGELTGTASYLAYPRGIENLTIDGNNLHFMTHTVESVNDERRELTHSYQAELVGDTLRVRMHTTGGLVSVQPQEFAMVRASAAK